MKKYLLILSIATLVVANDAAGQEVPQISIRDGIEYEIWHVLHSDGMIKKKGLFRRWRNAGWNDLYPSIYGVELVRQLPHEAKMVIALYLELIPEFWLNNDTEKQLSNALGGFSSFAKARAELLAGWKGSRPLNLPLTLKMKFSADTIFVNTNIQRGGERRRYDKFIVDNFGGVLFIEEPPYDVEDELYIVDYDNRLIREKYCDANYTFKLNGEEIDGTDYNLHYYLDPNNIASVVVGDWTQTVFIKQKDETVPWFSLSDIDLSQTATGVKNTKELKKSAIIKVDDGATSTSGDPVYRSYYDGETMIELSLVERISSGTYNNKYRTPWIIIRLKNS